MPILFLVLLALLPTAQGAAAARVAAAPARVYVERSAAGQLVNFDFVVENPTGEALAIVEIEVSVYDARGALVLRKFVNDNGAQPGVWTIDNRELAPRAAALVMNPLYFFDHAAELDRLDYTFTFASKEKKRHEARVKTVEGLPSYFNDFRRHLGSKSADGRRGQIDSGDIVEAR